MALLLQLALEVKIIWACISSPSSKTDLNAGIGEPCAGQSMATLVDSVLVNLEKSDSWENLGFAPPMGSKVW